MRSDIVESPLSSSIRLEDIFATFNQVSADLNSSYRELEARVSVLNAELAATHSARMIELTEKELMAAKLSALMESLPGGVVVLDAKGTIVEVNPAANQLLGERLRGKKWKDCLVASTTGNLIMEGEQTFKNGKIISINSSIYGDNSEKIILLTDVTENHRLNDLVNREKRLTALGEMAARLAHQVRTPLASAILYMSHFSFSTEANNSSRITSEKVLNRLRQIEGLVEGMLSYIRGTTSAQQECQLNKLLIDVREATQDRVQKNSGRLELRLLDEEQTIMGDREALYNAVTNLVINSLQAANKPSEIILGVKKANKSYLIAVEDNGPGIDDAIRDQIFDPFFSTRPNGTGLGLAVVLSAVKAHNGEISVSSSETGGAIFQLSIPDDVNLLTSKSGIWGARNHCAPDKHCDRPIAATKGITP